MIKPSKVIIAGAVVARLLRESMAVGAYAAKLETETLLPARLAGALAQIPASAIRAFIHFVGLLCDGPILTDFLFALLLGQAHTLNIGTHNFMHASLVAAASRDPVVRARLDAFVFGPFSAIRSGKEKYREEIQSALLAQTRFAKINSSFQISEVVTDTTTNSNLSLNVDR